MHLNTMAKDEPRARGNHLPVAGRTPTCLHKSKTGIKKKPYVTWRSETANIVAPQKSQYSGSHLIGGPVAECEVSCPWRQLLLTSQVRQEILHLILVEVNDNLIGFDD